LLVDIKGRIGELSQDGAGGKSLEDLEKLRDTLSELDGDATYSPVYLIIPSMNRLVREGESENGEAAALSEDVFEIARFEQRDAANDNAIYIKRSVSGATGSGGNMLSLMKRALLSGAVSEKTTRDALILTNVDLKRIERFVMFSLALEEGVSKQVDSVLRHSEKLREDSQYRSIFASGDDEKILVIGGFSSEDGAVRMLSAHRTLLGAVSVKELDYSQRVVVSELLEVLSRSAVAVALEVAFDTGFVLSGVEREVVGSLIEIEFQNPVRNATFLFEAHTRISSKDRLTLLAELPREVLDADSLEICLLDPERGLLFLDRESLAVSRKVKLSLARNDCRVEGDGLRIRLSLVEVPRRENLESRSLGDHFIELPFLGTEGGSERRLEAMLKEKEAEVAESVGIVANSIRSVMGRMGGENRVMIYTDGAPRGRKAGQWLEHWQKFVYDELRRRLGEEAIIDEPILFSDSTRTSDPSGSRPRMRILLSEGNLGVSVEAPLNAHACASSLGWRQPDSAE